MTNPGLTYKSSGVDYDAMDPFKRECQLMARTTAANLVPHGFEEVGWTRGESAYLMHQPATGMHLGHVEEGLGTKNLVADVMAMLLGRQYYSKCAQDTVAMIVNDLITLGALPLSLAMHLAVGDSGWFSNEDRAVALIRGWQHACMESGAVWAGGETPTLKGIIVPGTAELNGSAIGLIQPGGQVINPANIRSGDAIIMFASSGIHANGLTAARAVGEKVGFATRIGNGMTFGDALLEPTVIYVPLMRELLQMANINYAVNITGHGWRKLMRATQPFVYTITECPTVPPVFEFIRMRANVDNTEMYGNYNMGAGFAVYVNPRDVKPVLDAAKGIGMRAWEAGYIESQGTRKAVEIPSRRITFEADSMNLR